MVNLIVLEDKNIVAKGAHRNNKISQEALENLFFDGDLKALDQLNSLKIKYFKNKISLFYPGCGSDILFPLIYLEKMFPKVDEAKFIFVDLSDLSGLIKTVLDQIGITFSVENNEICFYWHDKFIRLIFIVDHVQDYINKISSFDIYFEKAFRIMREEISGYEEIIYEKLNPGGILISDSGFQGQNLKKIEVPKYLSAYGEMIIGIKE